MLKQFGQKTGWLTKYFVVENPDPASLTGNNKNLLIGVNHQKVIVTRKFNLANLLEFPIHEFIYTFSGNSLFIENRTTGKNYTFLGNNLLLLHNMVQKYKLIYEFERGM